MGKREDIVTMFGIDRVQKCENCGSEISFHSEYPFYDDEKHSENGYTFTRFCHSCYHMNEFKLHFDVSLERLKNDDHKWCDHDEEEL